jgi:hypothetical protein
VVAVKILETRVIFGHYHKRYNDDVSHNRELRLCDETDMFSWHMYVIGANELWGFGSVCSVQYDVTKDEVCDIPHPSWDPKIVDRREIGPSCDRIVTWGCRKRQRTHSLGRKDFYSVGDASPVRVKFAPYKIYSFAIPPLPHPLLPSRLSPLELQVFSIPILRLIPKNDACRRSYDYFFSPTCHSSRPT